MEDTNTDVQMEQDHPTVTIPVGNKTEHLTPEKYAHIPPQSDTLTLDQVLDLLINRYDDLNQITVGLPQASGLFSLHIIRIIPGDHIHLIRQSLFRETSGVIISTFNYELEDKFYNLSYEVKVSKSAENVRSELRGFFASYHISNPLENFAATEPVFGTTFGLKSFARKPGDFKSSPTAKPIKVSLMYTEKCYDVMRTLAEEDCFDACEGDEDDEYHECDSQCRENQSEFLYGYLNPYEMNVRYDREALIISSLKHNDSAMEGKGFMNMSSDLTKMINTCIEQTRMPKELAAEKNKYVRMALEHANKRVTLQIE